MTGRGPLLNEPAPIVNPDGSTGHRYPILDPAMAGKVEGFELRQAFGLCERANADHRCVIRR